MYKKIITIIVLLIFIPLKSHSKKIEIVLKIDNEIITNIDIIDEINYLSFLNPKIKSINKEKLYNIAKSSLTREIIKEKELNTFLEIKTNKFLKDSLEKKLINKLSLKDTEELKINISKNNLLYGQVLKKLTIESYWNQYIFEKFNKQISINEEYLRKQIKRQKADIKPKYEYYLFEILFDLNEKANLENKLSTIKNSISKNGFKSTANIYSISDTSNFGGEIGWIKETQVSEKILEKIKKINENEISEYIETPNGYLILKYSKKKPVIEKFDEEKNYKLLKQYEMNRQLNQFSLIHYKKLKKNTIIYEYK